MDLVFSIEVAYVQHLAVAIASIVKNCKSSEISFHILVSGISDRLKNKIQGIVNHRIHQVQFYNVPLVGVQDLLKIDGHATAANYYRLFLTEVLPESINKVLYLDADLIVLDDLNKLWNLNIDDYAIAAVHYPNAERSRVLNVPLDKYFNSGVMLINLDYWRKYNMINRYCIFLKEKSHLIQYWDQDVLNVVLLKKVLFLDLRYNFQKNTDVEEDTTILHYTGKLKPWHFHYPHLNRDYYFKYLRRTPWWHFGFKYFGLIEKDFYKLCKYLLFLI